MSWASDIFDKIAGRTKYPGPGKPAPPRGSVWWPDLESPYGRAVPLAFGNPWVDGLIVYAGPQFTRWPTNLSSESAGKIERMVCNTYTLDEATGAVTVEIGGEDTAAQSAVIVLCEAASDILDILKDGVSVHQGTPTTAEMMHAISAYNGIYLVEPTSGHAVPPSGELSAYFHGGAGAGAATGHTRFGLPDTHATATILYSGVAHVAFCALAIGAKDQRPTLRFHVRGIGSASDTVGATPTAVLAYLWAVAGMASTLDVATYYTAYCADGGGSGDAWVVDRAISDQTSARELIDSLLSETFSTAVTLENGTVQIVPRDQGDASATALGESDFVIDGNSDPVTVERRQDSDAFNCVPVTFSAVTASGSHNVVNEDTQFAAANPSDYGDSAGVHKSPGVSSSWVSSASHALNLSHLLAEESFNVRRTFRFRLVPNRWVLLQVGDTVSLTESHLGLSAQIARIVSLSEDASGIVSIEAEEFFGPVAFTTPAIDPTDGFGGTLPGNPTDRNTAAIDAMLSDGILAPVEKPNFLSISRQLYANLIYKYAWFWEHLPDGYSVTPPLYTPAEMFEFLLSDNVGFDALWFDIPALPSGDQAAAQAALDAWMLATTTIVDPATFQAEFQGSLTSVAEWEAYALTYVSSGPGVMNALGKTGVTAVTGTPSSSTFLRGDGTWADPSSSNTAYDLAWYTRDKPGNAEIIARWVAVHSLSFAADFAGSSVSAGIAASGETPLTVKKNGTQVGTLTFAASGTVPAMACTAWTCVAGDVITVEGPAGADATLALISITLAGVRTA